jgi:fibronectin type 3 domain-containing protein
MEHLKRAEPKEMSAGFSEFCCDNVVQLPPPFHGDPLKEGVTPKAWGELQSFNKKSFTLIAWFFITFFSSLAHAQKTGELPILPTPNGAILRWYLPNQTFPSGKTFRLERTNPDGSSTNIAIASPMAREEVEKQKLVDVKLFDYLEKLYATPPANDNEKFQRGIFDLKALADPKLSRALGVIYTDSGLQAGKKYSYKVFFGASQLGSSSLVTGQSPAVPVVGRITPSLAPTRISLSWATPANADIVAYRVFKAEGSGAFVPVQLEPYFPNGNTPNFVDDNFDPTKTYRYAVSSIDLFGREGKQSAAVAVDARDAAPLEPPRLLDVARLDDRLELRFTPVQDKRVTEIVVFRGSNIDKLLPYTKIPASSRSFVDKNVVGGTSYAYALAVQAKQTLSGRSSPKVAKAINTTPPKTPSGVKVAADTKTIRLTWAKNPEKDLSGYLVYRLSSKTAPLSQAALLTGKPISQTSFTDTQPEGLNQQFFYRVVALNTSGVRSASSDVVGASLSDKSPPVAPVLLNVSALENSVGLTFNNTDPDTVQLLVFRVSPQGRLQLVKKLPANATGFIDTTMIPNLPYVYTVFAVDKNGNRSKPSNSMVGMAVLREAPPPPTNIKLSFKNGKATLTWTRAKPRTYVVVYRLRGTEWIQISEVLEAGTFTFNAQKGEKYALRAIDLAGNLSDYTAPLEVK